MISRKAAEELTRKTVQNSRDILALYELLEKTDGKVDNLTTDVASLKTDVASLRTDVTGLKTDVTGLKTDVTGLKTDVASLTTHVADLDAKFEANSNHVNARFDRLEALLAPPEDDHSSVLRKSLEKKLRSLDG